MVTNDGSNLLSGIEGSEGDDDTQSNHSSADDDDRGSGGWAPTEHGVKAAGQRFNQHRHFIADILGDGAKRFFGPDKFFRPPGAVFRRGVGFVAMEAQ